ncbi:transcription factor [Schizophyllum commune]
MEKDSATNATPAASKSDEDARYQRRLKLRDLNVNPGKLESSKLDSSLKRHTALIKRMRLSLAADNRDQIMKDLDTLSLEKYIEEMPSAVLEGISRCKTEKDVWSAVEIVSALHRRFPESFTPSLVSDLAAALVPPSREYLSSLSPEQREKEDAARISRQRPILRLCSELALVGIIRDAPNRSGGEWIMKTIKGLLSNDPSLSSLPLLSTFLKAYSRPFLGISTSSSVSKQQASADAAPGDLSSTTQASADFPTLTKDADELVEQDIRDRFRRMCEGYFESVSKKLLIEHKHSRPQEQDRRNHEAYIRSGEIFEDRQQAYEKMTKNYEKLLSSVQMLSELLSLPMPSLPTASQKSDSILIGGAGSSVLGGDGGEEITSAGKWEDEEERRFYEDVQDLKDFVPKSVLGIEGKEGEDAAQEEQEDEEERQAREKEEVKKLEEELQKLDINGAAPSAPARVDDEGKDDEPDDEGLATPTPGTPKASTPPLSPHVAPQGPSQMLTALLARLSDATNRAMIDQAAIDFAFLNTKAARKRLVKFLSQVPKNRTDLLPHYSRLVATLNKYMPDIGTELVSILDEEFRYLQRKKNVVKELSEVRLKNIMFLSNLTKFRVVPAHVILHMFKVCLDDFSGTNVDNIALLLENCGRFLLRSDDTRERFATMLELMRRKQSMQHFDQRQTLLLENAYCQCNPPERAPIRVKERTPMELFIRHLIYDVLTKRTLDKVLKLIRKLDWADPAVVRTLHKVFTKPWKIKYGSISFLAMLVYDLQRYHLEFSIGVVDQVLEDVRRGLEHNIYKLNQQRVATVKYLGEMYIYRLMSSSIVFDTLWSLVTFGHRAEGRPLPRQPCPLDMPDDFFRIRLVCVLLDTCGMCFDRGTQRKKLDNFLTFFQYYVHCKDPLPMDVEFMLSDSMEAVRPKLTFAKSLEEAAVAVDEMINNAFQTGPADATDGEESGEDSGDEEEEGLDEDKDEKEDKEEDEEDTDALDSPTEERAPSPDDDHVVFSGSTSHENLGPSEEADAEFAKELAKMVMDTSAESRKVDKKTALALWDSAVLPQGLRRKKGEEADGEGAAPEEEGMKFTVITRRGNKQQTRQLAVPTESPLAVYTRTAQMQDKVEQQHLKRLVLDYEQREEAEEWKALEQRSRLGGGIKIRYVG